MVDLRPGSVPLHPAADYYREVVILIEAPFKGLLSNYDLYISMHQGS